MVRNRGENEKFPRKVVENEKFRNKEKPTSYTDYAASINISGAPSKIKCCRCDIVKGPDSFSNIYLKELKARMKKNSKIDPAINKQVPCTGCTGTQVLELFCQGCDRVRGKDQFNKTQRRNPDNCLCEPCSYKKRTLEPSERSSDEENSGSSDGSSDDEFEFYSAGTLTAGGDSTGISSLSLTDGGSSTGGVPMPSSGTGLSSNGTGPTYASSSKPSISTTNPSSTSNGTPSAKATPPHLRGILKKTSTPTSSSESKWAKPPAAVKKAREPVKAPVVAHEGPDDEIEVADSDDSDEDLI